MVSPPPRGPPPRPPPLTDFLARKQTAGRAPLTTDTGECADRSNGRPGEPCSSRRVLAALEGFVRAAGAEGEKAADPDGPAAPPRETASEAGPPPLPHAGAGAAAVRKAARLLGCSTESCVVAHPRFARYAGSSGEGGARLAAPALAAELARRFKPPGPRRTTALLSNFDLDAVLQQWAAAHPSFYNFPFCMMDFEGAAGGSLAGVDPPDIVRGGAPQLLGPGRRVSRPCTTFACVLNTDVSTGRGKHWVALFGDCRGRGGWSVEYFNSAGNPPPPPVTRWAEAAAAALSALRSREPAPYGAGPVSTAYLTDVRHQDSRTECGLYALYFIRRRLEGAPAAEFAGARIPDEAMRDFRAHVFRDGPAPR